jgi:NAD+ kinase
LLTRALITEGDHIKITASQFPFPTVCADKQSTDWFHSISRTLKWNERERQKSFVVVEEGPTKEERKHPRHKPVGHELAPSATKGVTDEEDEVSDEDGSSEEEKFDIDDLSENNTVASISSGSVGSGSRSSLVTSPSHVAASRAAEALMGMSPNAHAKARAKSRSRSGVRSGVDSPNRYASVPQRQSHGHGHVQWAASVPASAKASASLTEGALEVRTPTNIAHGLRTRSRSPGTSIVHPHQHPRAFAVWGQDESDSNSSDTDA